MKHIFHRFEFDEARRYSLKPAQVKDRVIAQLIDGLILGVVCSLIFFVMSNGGLKSIWVSPMFPQYLLEVEPGYISKQADFWWGGYYASRMLSYGKTIHISYPAPLLWGLYALYYSLFTRLLGQTPGKMLKKMVVLDLDGNPVDYKTALLRWGLYLVSLLPLGIGFWRAMKDEKQRTWHDLMAKTLVHSFERK